MTKEFTFKHLKLLLDYAERADSATNLSKTKLIQSEELLDKGLLFVDENGKYVITPKGIHILQFSLGEFIQEVKART